MASATLVQLGNPFPGLCRLDDFTLFPCPLSKESNLCLCGCRQGFPMVFRCDCLGLPLQKAEQETMRSP